MRYIKTNKIIKVYSYCIDLVRDMVGTREGVIAYDERFRIDLENLCYKSSMYNELQQRIDKAIEYMKYNATSNCFDEEKNMFRREIDLLEILKGGENNR